MIISNATFHLNRYLKWYFSRYFVNKLPTNVRKICEYLHTYNRSLQVQCVHDRAVDCIKFAASQLNARMLIKFVFIRWITLSRSTKNRHLRKHARDFYFISGSHRTSIKQARDKFHENSRHQCRVCTHASNRVRYKHRAGFLLAFARVRHPQVRIEVRTYVTLYT